MPAICFSNGTCLMIANFFSTSSHKMMSYVNVFDFGVLNMIFRNFNSTLIIPMHKKGVCENTIVI